MILAKHKSQTFVFGAIPLTNTIGVKGMAYFNAAYSIYVTFYMLSTAGIPVAISRMIAASKTVGNIKEVKKIFKISYWLFFTVGLAGTIVMMAFSRFFGIKCRCIPVIPL